jgi:Flp pilus assembly protein TadD
MNSESNHQQYHHSYSVLAHNEAMDILYSDNPSSSEISGLIELAHVAHWHWMKRDDKQPQNVSVSLWLLSRAYSANGFGEQSLHYAQESLETIQEEKLLPSFYGYSNEALARAHVLLENSELAKHHLDKAVEIAETVPNEQAKKYLFDQINRIEL